ncbi:hypothetical protein HYU22_04965 [Candidatus Woesearchaeota archaeon]|nr:hypothetical protein [Candidatus Woesearchaeota archaeon]
MQLLPASLTEIIKNGDIGAAITTFHKSNQYPYFLLADTKIEEQRTLVPERIDFTVEETHISIDSLVAVTPKRTTITLHQISGSFPPTLRRTFPVLQRYDQEEAVTVDLGENYPPAGYSRLHDPHRIVLDNLHTLPDKYFSYVGRGIFLDDSYWVLGLFGNWRAENLQNGAVVEKRMRLAHYHYEYGNERLGDWLIFVDVGRATMPSMDAPQEEEVPVACREAIRKLGKKYLLPKARNELGTTASLGLPG